MLLAALIYRKIAPEHLAEQGVRLEGDRTLANRFIDLFHLPAKIG